MSVTIKKVWRKRQNAWVWGYDTYVPTLSGKPKRKRVFEFATKAEATEAAGVLLAKINQAKHGLSAPSNKPLLADLIRKRLATITRKNELTRETRVLVEWLALLDPTVKAKERDVQRIQSRMQITGIGSPEIRLYADKRKADGVSAASVRRELTIIAATLHQADSFFPELAQWRPPRIPYPKVRKSRRERVISEQEYQAIIADLTRPPDSADGTRRSDRQNAYEARLRVAHIFQFAMHTGMRHSEITGLRWRDIDQPNNRILVLQSKTDRYKQIPITRTLAAVLEQRKQVAGQGEFIFTLNGNIYPKFYRILKTACQRCGIPYGKNTPNGIVLHVARHTVTTRLANDGLDYDTIGQITGHSAKELIAHYSHHSPASMKRAAEALERIGGNDGQS